MQAIKFTAYFGGFCLIIYTDIRLISICADENIGIYLYLHAYVLFPLLFLLLLALLLYFTGRKQKVYQLKAAKRLAFWFATIAIGLFLFS